MKDKRAIANIELFNKLKEMSNEKKFKIIELTENKEMTVTSIAGEIKLAYNKCSDYCARLEKLDLIEKRKIGKVVFVKSKINLKRLLEYTK